MNDQTFKAEWNQQCYQAVDDLGKESDTPIPKRETAAAYLVQNWEGKDGGEWREKTRRLMAVAAREMKAAAGGGDETAAEGERQLSEWVAEYMTALLAPEPQEISAQANGILILVMPRLDIRPDTEELLDGIEAALYLWLCLPEHVRDRITFPFRPLIEGWLDRPVEVEPADISTMPYALTHKRERNDRQLQRYGGPAYFGRGEGRQLILPGFEAYHEDGIYLPEQVYRLAEREGARRGVVSHAQRALIYAMLRTPAEKAASPTGYGFRVSGKEFVSITNQARKRLPKPHEWLPQIRATRDILNTVDIPYLDREGKQRFFTPALIVGYPLDVDDDIDFITRLPEGYNGLGVSISDTLWQFTNRAQAFYLLLSVPFLFDQPGITWRPRKDGGISHFKDVEAYPVVTRAMIASMANPFADGKTRYNLKGNAFELLEEVARLTGAFQIAKRKDARIILPPRHVVNVDRSAKAKGFAIVRKED